MMKKGVYIMVLFLLKLNIYLTHGSSNTELYSTMGLHFSASEEEIIEKYNELKSQRKVTYR
jgi:hypothetical protein